MPKPLSEKQIAMIKELINEGISDRTVLMKSKRKLAKKHGVGLIHNSRIIQEYQEMVKSGEIEEDKHAANVLKIRSVRTLSGIAPVAVLTEPWECPGQCAYCPKIKDVPTSYLPNEPAVMRAIHCGYSPYLQVQYRLRALVANGHEPTKIELIVIGGTWSVLPESYKFWFIKECFRAANEFKSHKSRSELESRLAKVKDQKFNSKIKSFYFKKLLNKEQKKNEKTEYQIIGITLETRPDYINEKELWQMRELGCTRVELGVQAIDDKILLLNKRGHGVGAIVEATKALKNFGFKVTYHLMPGLPGSTKEKDLEMFQTLFSDERFQPDQIKFYPTVVTRGSLLYRWWKAGKYHPYSDKELEELIVECKKLVPPYVRIIRLIRDIPSESIEAGNKVTNLRQVMQQRGAVCRCIRCREVKDGKFKKSDIRLIRREYDSSDGKEMFISYESKDEKTLYGFCRLRLVENGSNGDKEENGAFADSAIVRELHVYGKLVSVGSDEIVQHAGLGKKLLAEAEKIAKKNGFDKILVISGVGVRGYYKKQGYRLKNTYMFKRLK